MKLYIEHCNSCQQKIPLGNIFVNRSQLRQAWGSHFNIECPTCHSINVYNEDNVNAETDSNAKVGSGIIGGLVGLLGGPLGFIIGAGIGAAIGSTSDSEDQQKVNYFNTSH